MPITSLIDKLQIPGLVTEDEITLFSNVASLLTLFRVALVSYHYLFKFIFK